MLNEDDYQIKVLTLQNQELWENVAVFAKICSWQPTGNFLYNRMMNNEFSGWERVFAAINSECIIGFCTISKTSTAFGSTYSPYIGFIFVDESYRGNKISQKLCYSAIDYAKSIGYNKVFLYSDLINFYEKIGFEKIDEKVAPWGIKQSIYRYSI